MALTKAHNRMIEGAAVNVKDFGAVGDGTTDDTTAIQAAIDAAELSNTKLIFDGKTYKLNSRITIDISKVLIDGQGSTLDFSGISSGEAILITGSSSQPPYYQAQHSISNLEIFGDTSAGTTGYEYAQNGKHGIVFSDNGGGINASPSHLKLYNLNIHHFDEALRFEDSSYLISFYGCDVWQSYTAVSGPSGFSDYGENINFFGGVIYQVRNGCKIDHVTFDVYFHSVSFDALDTVCRITAQSTANFIGCHVETGGRAIVDNWFSVSGAGANIEIIGGKIMSRVAMDVKGFNGTHTGSNNASTLTDSSATFTTNELVGLTVYNVTDNSSGTITANTATTVTASLSGGTDNDWDTEDVYFIEEATIFFSDDDVVNGGISLDDVRFDINAGQYDPRFLCSGGGAVYFDGLRSYASSLAKKQVARSLNKMHYGDFDSNSDLDAFTFTTGAGYESITSVDTSVKAKGAGSLKFSVASTGNAIEMYTDFNCNPDERLSLSYYIKRNGSSSADKSFFVVTEFLDNAGNEVAEESKTWDLDQSTTYTWELYEQLITTVPSYVEKIRVKFFTGTWNDDCEVYIDDVVLNIT